ncbi:TraB/GumN family protein [Burkholderia ubonensis]|uniref:TraB/GumN family protein n=1 Tax=Burkholderia ubonensis TaxID=101571 RepID=UPI0009B35E10|nr:TraB/GumN family protein [Burkholderia ubonensis]
MMPFTSFVRRTVALIIAASSTFAAAASTGVPVLKVTAPNGQSSIFIGTLHVPVDGLNQPAPSIFAGARRYVVEHSGFSTLPADQGPGFGSARDWAKSLTDAEIDIYLQRAMCAGLSEKSARSWLNEPTPHEANTFAYTICPLPRHPMSRDVYLSSIAPAALAQHPEVLEDADWVELQRRKVPSSDDVSGFKWALAHDPKTVLEQTRDGLNAGNYDAIRAQVLESFGSAAAAAAYTKHMVDERNVAWLPRLDAILNDGHAVVVVGVMHFPGPNGLIALLRRRGYLVDAIEWPGMAPGDTR